MLLSLVLFETQDQVDMMMTEKPGSRCYVEVDDSGVPSLWENETLDYQLEKCELSFDASVGAIGTGKLYITSKRLIWLGESVDRCFDCDIPFIGLHAVTRDEQSYPKPCIYCQFNIDDDDALYGNDEEEDDGEEEGENSEMFLVPEKEEDLMKLFDALSHAAMLNPDPEEEGDELEGDFIYDLSEVELGAEQARALDHLESVFHLPGDEDEQENGEEVFEDAEEAYEEGNEQQDPATE